MLSREHGVFIQEVKMKTIKDKEYSFNHFKNNLKTRYDLDITRDAYDKLCSQVSEHFTPISTEKQKRDTQRIYLVSFDLPDNKQLLAKLVWSEKRQCLTTVLPKESCYYDEKEEPWKKYTQQNLKKGNKNDRI